MEVPMSTRSDRGAASRERPTHPDPEQLRRQAKELLRDWRRGDPAALERAAPYRLPPPPRLVQAQLVIAREAGFGSWAALLADVEQRREAALGDDAFVDRVVTLALGRGYDAPKPQKALALMDSRPSFRPPVLRLLRGEAPAEPLRPDAPLPPWGAPPLALVAFSSLATVGFEAALLERMDALLMAGADPNGRLADPDVPYGPLPLLYGAVARARSGAMVRRLLEAGADPNDNESLYHAVEQPDRSIVAALAAAGARWEGTNALFRQLDFDDLPGLRQALELGADANELSPTGGSRPLHHAVARGRSLPFLELLMAHGADPHAQVAGHGLAWHAARAGRTDLLGPLAALGLVPGAGGARERFIAACAAGDEPAARAALAEEPGLIGRLDAHDLALLPEQAQRGHRAAVRLMLSLGWPVSVPGPWQASALNQAAFRGDAEMVALLLQHGARWHERNGYGGTALGSCLHAGNNEPVAGGDYGTVLRLLVADGAPRPDDEELTDEMVDAVA
jgi:ankyrin repeat protein